MKATQDTVEVARKELADASAAVAKEGKRYAAAIEKADRFAAEAASVDSDDERAFEKASKQLAELRAATDLIRGRREAAATRLETARAALDAAELAAASARLTEINAAIESRHAQALEDMREALRAFDDAAQAIRKLTDEGRPLAAKVYPERPKALARSNLAALTGSPARAVQLLAGRGELRI